MGIATAAGVAAMLTSVPASGAQDLPSLTHYSIVSFMDLREGVSAQPFAEAWAEVSHLVRQEDGIPTLVRLEGGLENAGSTDPLDLPADYLAITRFAGETEARAFLAAADGHESYTRLRGMIATEVSVLTTVPPGNQAPVFSSEQTRPRPAFLLVNPIDMQEDERANRVLEYSAAAFPLVMDRGVRFTAPFTTVEVLRGTTGMDVLYITDWPDLATFHGVHSDPRWLEVVPMRNEGVRALSDLRGYVVSTPGH